MAVLSNLLWREILPLLIASSCAPLNTMLNTKCSSLVTSGAKKSLSRLGYAHYGLSWQQSPDVLKENPFAFCSFKFRTYRLCFEVFNGERLRVACWETILAARQLDFCQYSKLLLTCSDCRKLELENDSGACTKIC